MTTITLTRKDTQFVKPFDGQELYSYRCWLEPLPPLGAEISETYDYHYTYIDSEGCTYTDTEKFFRELTAQQVEDYWGYFVCERDCVEPLYVTVTYPHCNLPVHLLYEGSVDEF